MNWCPGAKATEAPTVLSKKTVSRPTWRLTCEAVGGEFAATYERRSQKFQSQSSKRQFPLTLIHLDSFRFMFEE